MKLYKSLIIVFLISTLSSAYAQLNSFTLSPSGTTDVFMKYVPKPIESNGSVYISGYLTLSSYMNQATGVFYDPGIPHQKFQMQGGNILLCRTHLAVPDIDINPTSKNGAILFSDFVTSTNNWTNGKWGIEYDDQYSTGGLNFFKPYSSIATERINFNLFIKNDGLIGIGTGDPKAKLEVKDGDIFISDINKGIIMKSPDGNCWRGTLNNDGQLVFEQLADCFTVNVDNEKLQPGFKIFPNPAAGFIEISFQGSKQTSVVSIYSLKGDLVKTLTMDKNLTRIDVSSLSSGTYLIKIVNAESVSSEKFVIK